MSVKRAAKQLRRKQAGRRRRAIARTKPLSAKQQTIMGWIRDGRPEWMSKAHWEATIASMPKRAGAKMRKQAREHRLGLTTRSY